MVCGYSGNHVAVVWLGLDDNKVTGLTGSSGALPVWINVMKQLRQTPVNLRQPDSVQWQWIDRASGTYRHKLVMVPCIFNASAYSPTSCYAMWSTVLSS